jgi:hypothetical protein
MPTFTEQATSLDTFLTTVKDTYNNVYSMRTGDEGNSITNTELQNKVVAMRAQLRQLEGVSDTYDREYLDRMADKPLGGFWRSRGVSTLQDWVLLIFFSLYILITICIIILMMFNLYNPATYIIFTALGSFVVGVMIAAVLVRFG